MLTGLPLSGVSYSSFIMALPGRDVKGGLAKPGTVRYPAGKAAEDGRAGREDGRIPPGLTTPCCGWTWRRIFPLRSEKCLALRPGTGYDEKNQIPGSPLPRAERGLEGPDPHAPDLDHANVGKLSAADGPDQGRLRHLRGGAAPADRRIAHEGGAGASAAVRCDR